MCVCELTYARHTNIPRRQIYGSNDHAKRNGKSSRDDDSALIIGTFSCSNKIDTLSLHKIATEL